MIVREMDRKSMLDAKFLESCKSGDISNIKKVLLYTGWDLFVEDEDGYNGFHLACENGHCEVLKLLIEKGMDVNMKNRDGISSFHLACNSGISNVVSLLLDKGMNINEQNDDSGSTGFHIACQSGSNSLVKLLLDKGVNMLCSNLNDFTGFHMACHEGHYEVVQLLIERGMDIYIEDGNGFNGFHIACGKGQIENILVLLDEGMDINTKNRNGISGLHLACSNSRCIQAVVLLLDEGIDMYNTDINGLNCFHIACRSGNIECVKLLLEKNMNMYEQNNEGATGFHMACQNGHLDIINLLLDKGFNIFTEDNNGFTGCHTACKYDELETFKLLLSRGSDINLLTNEGCSFFHIACIYSSLEMIIYLMVAGLNISIENCDGCTGFHLACKEGNTEVVKLLLESNVLDIDSELSNSMNCFHIACYYGRIDIVKLLYHYGININIEDKDGYTGFHFACQENHIDVVTLLFNRGINANLKTINGLTGFQLARSQDLIMFLSDKLNHSYHNGTHGISDDNTVLFSKTKKIKLNYDTMNQCNDSDEESSVWKEVSHRLPGFISKCYQIFNSQEFENYCSWGDKGRTIILKNVELFSKIVLPKFFKHSNVTSFVRQLNMYDFHKTIQDPNHNEFRHKYFQQYKPELLVKIVRKAHVAKDNVDSLKKSNRPPSRPLRLSKNVKVNKLYPSSSPNNSSNYLELNKFKEDYSIDNSNDNDLYNITSVSPASYSLLVDGILSSQLPVFISKCYQIFNSQEFENYCSWGDKGRTIILKNVELFSKIVLPKFFKHSNVTSFVRQLNMYDFHKTIQDPNHNEFRHKYFQQYKPELLVKIVRKAHVAKDNVDFILGNVPQKKSYRPHLPSSNSISSPPKKIPVVSTKNRNKEIFCCGEKCNFETNYKDELERHLKSKLHSANISPEIPDRCTRNYEIHAKDNSARNTTIPVYDNSTVRVGKRTIIKRQYDDILYIK